MIIIIGDLTYYWMCNIIYYNKPKSGSKQSENPRVCASIVSYI